MPTVVRFIARLVLVLAAALASPAAFAVDSGDVVVVSSKGEVHFTVSGVARAVRAGGVLELPATLRTGRDGAVELRQGVTTVSIGPETLLDFPAPENRGAPIDRIVQPRGNALYNIGKREGRKLRVETPFLVAVIKGTQFTVAALDESTTISLFEGLLEVRATDDSDVIDLKAGEIASRRRGDKSISVIRMDAGKTPTTAPRPSSGSGSNNDAPPRATPPNQVRDLVLVERGPVPVGASASLVAGSGSDLGVNAAANVANVANVQANAALNTGASGVDVAAGARVDAGAVALDTAAAVNVGSGSVDVSTHTSVSAGPISVDAGAAVTVGSSGIDAGATASVNAGPVAVDTGVNVNAGSAGVDVSTSTSVDAGPVSVDTGAGVDVGSTGVDVSTSTSVDAGPISADVGSGTSVDAAAGTVDTSVATSVDAGPLTTDVGAAAVIDLGAGTAGAGVDVGAGTPLAAIDTGATVGADLTAGSVDLGLTIAGADLDLGVDPGPGNDVAATPSTDTSTTETVVDVGGLLDRLLRRPGRK